jgi:pectin-derived oligosaccharide transport system permease protein
MSGVAGITEAEPRRRRRHDGVAAYLFLSPWLLGLLVLTMGPLLTSLYLSLTDFDLLEIPQWVGIANYQQMLGDDRFWTALRVSLTYVALSVPLKLLVALALAMLLNKGLRGLTLYRAVLYLPSLLGSSVAVALLWHRVFEGDGLANRLLSVFGISGPSWISDPRYALGTLVLLAAWQFGSPMIVFLAGLRQSPSELYDAASVDGAYRLRQFRRITLPMLTPVIFFNLIFQTIEALKAFTQAYVISAGTGGPTDSTLFFTLYLYQEAFTNFHMGYASALAWVLMVMIGCLTALLFIGSRYWVHYDE